MNRNRLLKELVAGIKEIYNDTVESIVLYGSVAKGTDEPESDIDIALILKSNETKGMKEKRLDLIVDLELEFDEVLSVLCIDKNTFEKWHDTLPFYMNVRKEGVVLWEAA